MHAAVVLIQGGIALFSRIITHNKVSIIFSVPSEKNSRRL